MSSSALAHIHRVHCSFRRLLSNHQRWSIAAALLSRTYQSLSSGSVHLSTSDREKIEKHRIALFFAHKERYIDRGAREAFTNALHDILKHRKMLGLTYRKDGCVSVRELLNYQHFRMLSFTNLQKLVNEDRLRRFELLFEPMKGGDVDSWWIRVKEVEEKDVKYAPIVFGKGVGIAIYATTLEAWRSYISIKGISRGNDKHIQISRGVPIRDFFVCALVQFYLVSKPSPSIQNSRAALRSFARDSDFPSGPDQNQPPSPTEPYVTHHKNKWTWIITPGNKSGFLPPECFSKVEVVRVERKVLWTSDEEVVEQGPSDENEEEAILDSDMESAEDAGKYTAVDTTSESGLTEHVKITEGDMDQFFIDLPIDQTRVVNSDLKKEALTILSA